MTAEFPKWVNGRIAANEEEARVLERHTQECGIHPTEIVKPDPPAAEFLRPRMPEAGSPSETYEGKCTCGAAFNGADPAKFDHDNNGRPGGSRRRQ